MLPIFTTQGEQAPMGKVELDLEGAPFLEPEPEDEGPSDASSQPVQRADEDEAPKKSRKKLFTIIGIVFVLLFLIGVAAAYFILIHGDKREFDPSMLVVVVPSGTKMDEAPVDKFNIAWEPFWVEVADPEGEIRFVYCKLILVTDNQRIALQINNKDATIRDAVYYYLRHKPYSFLADLRQLNVLKSEILNIINYYIIPETVIPPGLQPGEGPPPDAPKERLREVLIEEYLIK